MKGRVLTPRIKAGEGVKTELAVESWPVDRAKPYPRNPRKVTDAAIITVAASITEFGWRQPRGAQGVLHAGERDDVRRRRLPLVSAAGRGQRAPVDFGKPIMTRPTCEACPAIDIRDWAAWEFLVPGARWTINCYRGDEQQGTIHAAIGDDRVTLSFNARDRHGKEHPRRQDVGLAYATPRFGGRRPWFTCPACERRCALLYYRRGRFACRTCQGLSYASQSRRNRQEQRTEAPAETTSETASLPVRRPPV